MVLAAEVIDYQDLCSRFQVLAHFFALVLSDLQKNNFTVNWLFD